MRDHVDHLNTPIRARATPSPVRFEMVEIWLQSGSAEGVSMEWMFDREVQNTPMNEGHA